MVLCSTRRIFPYMAKSHACSYWAIERKRPRFLGAPFSLVVKQAELTDVPSVYALERYSEHTCS